ncbi:MAG: UDP-N-acetylmuramoyl-tripeptide--D-alanyl-D-alanine ligase [Planctomycetota bacterium]|nr:MAG: UDP-N-acetylmuramoyl-tripeptide--D-alanyl-D-alanine ligase [Planctomycetota bacterium]
MEPLSLEKICDVLQGRLLHASISPKKIWIENIFTDSRRPISGGLFWALEGERWDGHQFLEEVQGMAKAAVVHRVPEGVSSELPLVLVRDTAYALGELASYYRSSFSLPLIAVTGSNGKTTTKEMIGYLLSRYASTLRSPQSFNNRIGVPLTLFSLERGTCFAVVELGASGMGEIAQLCRIARPTAGVLTSIAPAHLEGFRDLEGVMEAKGELLEYLEGAGGPIFINVDNIYCRRMASRYSGEVIGFGISREASIRASELSCSFDGIRFRCGSHVVHLPMLGRHNVYCALAAIAVAQYYGLPAEIWSSWEGFRPPGMRLQPVWRGGICFLNDAYNANPASMVAAIETLGRLPVVGRRVLVLGDMLELGEDTWHYHQELARWIDERFSAVFVVGRHMQAVVEELPSSVDWYSCGTVREVVELLEGFLRPQDVVLLKGSRRMKLEQILLDFAA